MTFLYRALNEYDILCNPLYNGLASKKLIFELTQNSIINSESHYFNSLSKKEQDLYVKSKMNDYLKKNQSNLSNKFLNKSKNISKNVSKFNRMFNFSIDDYNKKYTDIIIQHYFESWLYICYYLSSLNNHLVNGSKTMTDWISFTSDINNTKKYYDSQDYHNLAIIGTNSYGLCDNNTLIVDLSSKEKIEFILDIISKKINSTEFNKMYNEIKEEGFTKLLQETDVFNKSNINFMGYNFSAADKQWCVYNFLSQDNILSILETLQIDLLGIKRFNLKDYCILPKENQIEQLKILKELLKRKIVNQNDTILLNVYLELYYNNKNERISNLNIFEKNNILLNKTKILKLASEIPNIQIKH